MVEAIKPPNVRRFFATKVFSDTPEESSRLRLLTLGATIWVALSVLWITGNIQTPLIAGVLAVIGHWVSWKWRHGPLGIRTPLTAVAIVGLALIERERFVDAIAGDRLPVAEVLLLVSAFAGFGMRTRGGLYAQLGLSGAVLFFVSEQAFDAVFVLFLTGFIGLFLTFYVMAFLEDQFKQAEVHWHEGQLSRFVFWIAGVGGGLLVASALAFLLLPADFRGNGSIERQGVVPFMGDARGPLASELDTESQQATSPDTSNGFGAATQPQPLVSTLVHDINSLGVGEDQIDTPTGGTVSGNPVSGESVNSPSGGNGGGSNGSGSGGVDATQRPFVLIGTSLEGGSATLRTDLLGEPISNDTVMHVRISVTSYWRGQLYDLFDGQTWKRSGARRTSRGTGDGNNYYWQAFFIHKDQPTALLSGYNPILTFPRSVSPSGTLEAGTSYSVLSESPTLDRNTLPRASAGFVRDWRVTEPLPSSIISDLADHIVGNATAPGEKVWRIVSYLRRNYKFDEIAPDQLQLSTDVESFLGNNEPGTSLDFASATVLLARAVGVPARLAVGYLPGRLDPFTGTHLVRESDAHAWAEINFFRHGWVAFDPSPRPELEVFNSGNPSGFNGSAYVFQQQVGGSLYCALQTGSNNAVDTISDTLRSSAGTLRSAAVGLAVIAGIAGLAWALYSYWSRTQSTKVRYSLPYEEVRREVFRTLTKLERLLRRNGLDARLPSQTVADYLSNAIARFSQVKEHLEWFSQAGWVAAYDGRDLNSTISVEASRRLTELGKRGRLAVQPDQP